MKLTKFTLVTALFAVVTLSIAATAQAGAQRFGSSKEIEPAPVMEPEFSWTGFYIGGNLGGVWNNFNFGQFTDGVDVDEQFLESDVFVPLTNGDGMGGPGFENEFFVFPNFITDGFNAGTADGFIGGGQLGFQKQFGHLVVGLEGDFDRTGTNRSLTFTRSAQQMDFLDDNNPGTSGFGSEESLEADTTLTATRRAEVEWMASARARLGWAKGHVLLYATGGGAFAQVSMRATDTAITQFFFNQAIFENFNTSGPGIGPVIFNHIPIGTANNIKTAEDSDILTGWTGGGGGEWAVTDMVSIGVEYRHTDLGSHTFHFADNSNVISQGPTKVTIESDQVTIRFNILLNSFFGR